jgi:hypothetical protein
LLAELSAKLVHVEAGGLDAALGDALRQLVVFLGVDRGNLDEYVDGAPGVRVSWAEPGVETLPSILAAGHFVWTADMLRRGGVVQFPRTDCLPPEAAADRASYERLGTRSHLSIPLQAGGPMLGVLSFDAVRWSASGWSWRSPSGCASSACSPTCRPGSAACRPSISSTRSTARCAP